MSVEASTSAAKPAAAAREDNVLFESSSTPGEPLAQSTMDGLASAAPQTAPPSAAPEKAAPVDMRALLRDILDNPEKLLDESAITPEQVLELQKGINPYAFMAGEKAAAGVKRTAAVTYTNLRADYIKRFTMTSLVAFIFQMEKEWEVPADVRKWIPNPKKKREKDAKPDPLSDPFDPDKLVEKLEATIAVAKEAQLAKAELKTAQQKFQDLETKTKAAEAVAFAAATDARIAKELLKASKADSGEIQKMTQEHEKLLEETKGIRNELENTKLESGKRQELTKRAAQLEGDARRIATLIKATHASAEEKTKMEDVAKTIDEEVKKSNEALMAARTAFRSATAEHMSAGTKAAGLLFAATHAVSRDGKNADRRMDETILAAAKFPDCRAILNTANVKTGVGAQIEIPQSVAKSIIAHFLKTYLEFDPITHSKSAHDSLAAESTVDTPGVGPTDKDDPERLPLSVIRAAAPKPTGEDKEHLAIIMKDRRSYAAACAAIRDSDLAGAILHAVQFADRFKRYLYPIPKKSPARTAVDRVPPQDTFHRWNYFTEVNYEELRTAVESIYGDKPDLDWALAIWEVFEGASDKVDDQFKRFCELHEEDAPSSIKAIDLGGWTLLGDFKKNRERLTFYNKHTEVIKRIMERHTEDQKLGRALMENRVRQLKAKNIREEGPDAPGLKEYKKALQQPLTALGAQRVISPEEMKRLEKARGDPKAAQELKYIEDIETKMATVLELKKSRPLSEKEEKELDTLRGQHAKAREMLNVPEDALQVDVFTHDPARGTLEKTHFYTKAEAPEHMAELRKQREAMADTAGASLHPVVQSQAKGLAASAQLASGAQPLAPWALAHIQRELGQTPEESRARAAADHDSSRRSDDESGALAQKSPGIGLPSRAITGERKE